MEQLSPMALPNLSKEMDEVRHQKALDSLKKLKGKGAKEEEKLWEAARGFESMFLHQMYKAMRKTIPENEGMPASPGRKIFTDMLDMEYSKIGSGDSKQGLAGLIYRQLLLQRNGVVAPPEAAKGMASREVSPKEISGYSGQNKLDRTLGPKMNLEDLDPIIQKASEKYGVDFNLIKSVITAESDGRPGAKSHAGAMGLMQLMEGTAKEMGVKRVYDPEENVMGGTRYLSMLLGKYNGDEQLSLAAYNAGPGRVKEYGGVPPFEETCNYIDRVQKMKRVLDSQNSEPKNALLKEDNL